MPKTTRFLLRYCENGHVTWRLGGEKTGPHCSTCGKPFVHTCPSCSKALPKHFDAPSWNSGKPANDPPPPPDFCTECGAPFPWTTDNVESEAIENAATTVERICHRFHKVAKQLRDRRENRPTLTIEDEYDVQDLLSALLRLHFDDIRSEEHTPSYAGGSSRIDFLLKDESIGVEVKIARSSLKDKQVGSQLIDDKERYKAHPDCKSLICLVYDPEDCLANPVGLMNDLSVESEDGLRVVVIVSPVH